MKCLYCGSEQSSVIDKRAVKGSGEIRRRRECLKCSRRFTTYERIKEEELLVIKRDGRKELFERSKLRAGILKALEKRPSFASLEEITDKVEKKIRVKGLREVPSKNIGQLVLSELKKIDPVAYLRFVSVYRQFANTTDFTKELESLQMGTVSKES